MAYIRGKVKNIKIHQKQDSSSANGKTTTTTQFIHSIDIDGKGYTYISDKPANISVDHIITAKQSIFSRKLNAICNCTNETYAGQSVVLWFVLLLGMIIAQVILFIYQKPLIPAYSFKTYHFIGTDVPFHAAVLMVTGVITCLLVISGVIAMKTKKKLYGMCMLQ